VNASAMVLTKPGSSRHATTLTRMRLKGTPVNAMLLRVSGIERLVSRIRSLPGAARQGCVYPRSGPVIDCDALASRRDDEKLCVLSMFS
jgi:hypothetical protein